MKSIIGLWKVENDTIFNSVIKFTKQEFLQNEKVKYLLSRLCTELTYKKLEEECKCIN